MVFKLSASEAGKRRREGRGEKGKENGKEKREKGGSEAVAGAGCRMRRLARKEPRLIFLMNEQGSDGKKYGREKEEFNIRLTCSLDITNRECEICGISGTRNGFRLLSFTDDLLLRQLGILQMTRLFVRLVLPKRML
jgi:hypothetical protein